MIYKHLKSQEVFTYVKLHAGHHILKSMLDNKYYVYTQETFTYWFELQNAVAA